MPFALEPSASGFTLTLSGRLGVRDARALWEQLEPALGAGTPVLVEASELGEVDTSIVQLLCRGFVHFGMLTVGPTSDGFFRALQQRGLEQFFIRPRPTPRRIDARAPELYAAESGAALIEPAVRTRTRKRARPKSQGVAV